MDQLARTTRRTVSAGRRSRAASLPFALLLVLGLLAACSTPSSVTSVSIDQDDQAVAVGQDVELTATVEVEGDASQDVTWSTGDASIAAVDEATGLVTGVAAGEAAVTATSVADSSVSDSVAVTVTEDAAVLSVTIVQDDVAIDTLGMTVGDAPANLTATVVATGDASETVAWTSDDVAVATVADGVVTPVAAGETTVVATSTVNADASDSVTVTVTEPVPATIDSLAAAVVAGSQVDLTWTATDATSFDLVCFDGADEQALDSAAASASGATIGIPASDCQTVRVHARGEGADDTAEVVLDGPIVMNGDDDGVGSLRATLGAADAEAIVGFAADVTEVVLATLGTGEAHLVLDQDVTISGPEAGVAITSDTILDYELRSRVFHVPAGTTATLDNLTITGGTFNYHGGGVWNEGTLTLTDSIIEGNEAWYEGGGLANDGTLTVEGTMIRDNTAHITNEEITAGHACIGNPDNTTCTPGDADVVEFDAAGNGYGGGFFNRSGDATFTDSQITANRATYYGGGVHVEEGSVTLTDTDVTGNVASDDGYSYNPANYGGGIFNAATFAMTGGEVSGNTSQQVGGGLGNGTDPELATEMTLTGVTVTGNTAEGAGTERGGGLLSYYDVDPGDTLVLTDATIEDNTPDDLIPTDITP